MWSRKELAAPMQFAGNRFAIRDFEHFLGTLLMSRNVPRSQAAGSGQFSLFEAQRQVRKLNGGKSCKGKKAQRSSERNSVPAVSSSWIFNNNTTTRPAGLFSKEFIVLNSIFFIAACTTAVFFQFQHYLQKLGIDPVWAGFIIGVDSLASFFYPARAQSFPPQRQRTKMDTGPRLPSLRLSCFSRWRCFFSCALHAQGPARTIIHLNGST